VRAGADATVADGTREQPLVSLADAERCVPEGATIRILSGDGEPLSGGIILKNGQRLLGEARHQGGQHPRLVQAQGDAVLLADGNEVAGLQIEVGNGAAIFGDNVTGAHLHDLLITRLSRTQVERVEPSLCHRVVAGGELDDATSVLRGCNSWLKPMEKAAILLLSDGRSGHSAVEHAIRRVTIVDNVNAEKEVLWAYGIYANALGTVTVTLEIEHSSLAGMERGIIGRSYEQATLAVRVEDTSVDSLLSDGIVVSTGFGCSGLGPETRLRYPCAELIPVPVSNAKVLLNVSGYRFTDSQRRGRPDDAAAIETFAMDQGHSEIEVHVQDSDLTGAAAPGFFTFYYFGHPARDLIDFGCVNPASGDPREIGEDRTACLVAGYSSPGRNRIFGNTWGNEWSSSLAEVALIGPGRLMAQGNYWGDRAPSDGQGDALGDCSRLLAGPDGDEPVLLVPNARCELYDVPGHGAPKGIDARFHLLVDPRPQ